MRRHDAARFLDELVADVVAVSVVNRLEPVQVQAVHGQRPAGARQLLQRVPQPVLEQGAVGQSGQCVMIGQVRGTCLAGDEFAGGVPCPPVQPRDAGRQAEQHGQRRHAQPPEQHAAGRLRRPDERGYVAAAIVLEIDKSQTPIRRRAAGLEMDAVEQKPAGETLDETIVQRHGGYHHRRARPA